MQLFHAAFGAFHVSFSSYDICIPVVKHSMGSLWTVTGICTWKKNVFEAFPFHIFLWGLDLCSPTKCLNSLCVVAGMGVSPAEWWNTDREEEGHYNQSKNMMLSIDAIHPGNIGIKEALCVKGAVFFPVHGEAAVSVLSTRHRVCRISLVQKA